MEVAASLTPPRPWVVFCTAFDRYAIDAFDHHAVDYLLKPVGRERLARALDRVRRSLHDRRQSEAAGEAQAHLYPSRLPAGLSLEIGGESRSAHDVGGDYYDFVALPGRRVGLALADVSGKGLFAGLLMAGLQARVQLLAGRYGDAVGELAGELNRQIHGTLQENRYATLFWAVWSEDERVLRYVNAGHTPPGVVPAGPGPVRTLEPTGTVIGLLPDATWSSGTARLDPGDVLVAVTDGVAEVENGHGETFGLDRIAGVVRSGTGRSAAELCDAVLSAAEAFRGERAARDDATVVVARAT